MSGSRPRLLASEIPVAHTPPGGWRDPMPPPVLAGCDEPIADGVPDLRGTWQAVSVTENGQPLDELRHVERIEQAGRRVVITSRPIIHDMVADGTLENGVHDVSGFDFEPVHVAAAFEDGKLVLRPGNMFVAVTRHIEDEELIWNLLPRARVTRMRRIE